jgi:hypothetical protein
MELRTHRKASRVRNDTKEAAEFLSENLPAFVVCEKALQPLDDKVVKRAFEDQRKQHRKEIAI